MDLDQQWHEVSQEERQYYKAFNSGYHSLSVSSIVSHLLQELFIDYPLSSYAIEQYFTEIWFAECTVCRPYFSIMLLELLKSLDYPRIESCIIKLLYVYDRKDSNGDSFQTLVEELTVKDFMTDQVHYQVEELQRYA